MTDMDDVLRAHAQRWADRQPPPPLLELPHAPARRHRVLAVAAAVVLAVALALGIALTTRQGSRQEQAASVSPAVRTRLLKIVHLIADYGPGNRIDSAQAVRTGHGTAEAVMDPHSGGNSDTDHGTWLVQIRGQFVCGVCKIPPKARTPRGTVYTVIVNATNYEVDGFGLGSRRADLSDYGPVLTLIR